MIRLFLYGTLQDPDVFEVVCLHPLKGSEAYMRDYKALYAQGEVYPILAPSSGSQIPGIVVDVDDAALSRILFFEEAGESYELASALALPKVGSSSFRLENAKCFVPLNLSPGTEIWSLEEWTARHKETFLEDAAIFMRDYR